MLLVQVRARSQLPGLGPGLGPAGPRSQKRATLAKGGDEPRRPPCPCPLHRLAPLLVLDPPHTRPRPTPPRPQGVGTAWGAPPGTQPAPPRAVSLQHWAEEAAACGAVVFIALHDSEQVGCGGRGGAGRQARPWLEKHPFRIHAPPSTPLLLPRAQATGTRDPACPHPRRPGRPRPPPRLPSPPPPTASPRNRQVGGELQALLQSAGAAHTGAAPLAAEACADRLRLAEVRASCAGGGVGLGAAGPLQPVHRPGCPRSRAPLPWQPQRHDATAACVPPPRAPTSPCKPRCNPSPRPQKRRRPLRPWRSSYQQRSSSCPRPASRTPRRASRCRPKSCSAWTTW
jgi:hypothetical protein